MREGVVEEWDAGPLPARTLLVLGGGGSLGAYQAGAVLALAEAGALPDALFGCSAGALNAAFLACGPSRQRAQELASWWVDPRTSAVLSPSLWPRLRGYGAAATARVHGLFDDRPLRRLIAAQVPAHDLSELAVPLTVTTTCLDCGTAVHHTRGAVGDVLAASCALPGIFPPVRLPDTHLHVDGGVLCGVPIQTALDAAGPRDRVLVIDCALAPVTGLPGRCAAQSASQDACGLPARAGLPDYQAPAESSRGAADVALRSFTVARAAANRASVAGALEDPRVQVLPHIADAWAAGILTTLPAGPRDTSAARDLIEAGHQTTRAWLALHPQAARVDGCDEAPTVGRI